MGWQCHIPVISTLLQTDAGPDALPAAQLTASKHQNHFDDDFTHHCYQTIYSYIHNILCFVHWLWFIISVTFFFLSSWGLKLTNSHLVSSFFLHFSYIQSSLLYGFCDLLLLFCAVSWKPESTCQQAGFILISNVKS